MKAKRVLFRETKETKRHSQFAAQVAHDSNAECSRRSKASLAGGGSAACFSPQWKKWESRKWEERARCCTDAAKACQGAVFEMGVRTRYSTTKNTQPHRVAL